MFWLFGFITGMVFDMPTWWWVLGFIMALLSDGCSCPKSGVEP